MEEVLKILENPVFLAALSGIGATIITFLFSTVLNHYLSIRENKKNNRAFLSFDEKILRYDTYPEVKESSSKVMKTDDYAKLLSLIEENERGLRTKNDSKVPFIALKNLGPGNAIQIEVSIRLILSDSDADEGWRLEISVPILESGQSVYIPLMKYEHYKKDFHITDTEFKYITQVNEKMKLSYSAKKNRDNNNILDGTEKLTYRQFGVYRKLYKSVRSTTSWIIFYDNK